MEKIIMGNTALVEELAGADELEELFGIDASESEPEDDEDFDDDEFGDEDDEDDEDADDEGLDPEEIPHG